MPKYPYLSINSQVPRSEKGSALPSALLFLFLLSAFLMSLSQTAKHQIIGHQLMQDSYRAQTLLTLTEKEIRQKEYEGKEMNAGDYVFNVGSVQVEETLESLQLTATLQNGFTKVQTLSLKAPMETNEEGEERKEEKGEENKKSERVDPFNEEKGNHSSSWMEESIEEFEERETEKTEENSNNLTKELDSTFDSKYH